MESVNLLPPTQATRPIKTPESPHLQGGPDENANVPKSVTAFSSSPSRARLFQRNQRVWTLKMPPPGKLNLSAKSAWKKSNAKTAGNAQISAPEDKCSGGRGANTRSEAVPFVKTTNPTRASPLRAAGATFLVVGPTVICPPRMMRTVPCAEAAVDYLATSRPSSFRAAGATSSGGGAHGHLSSADGDDSRVVHPHAVTDTAVNRQQKGGVPRLRSRIHPHEVTDAFAEFLD